MAPDELMNNLRPRSLFKWIFLSPLVVPLGWWVSSWSWGSSNASGWVQAAGSLLALAIALWLPWRENKRRELDESYKAIGLARRLYYAAYELSATTANMFQGRVYIGYEPGPNIEMFSRFLVRLNTTFDDDHDPTRVKLTHELRQNLPPLIAYLNEYRERQDAGEERFRWYANYYDSAVGRCWAHLCEMEACLAEKARSAPVHRR